MHQGFRNVGGIIQGIVQVIYFDIRIEKNGMEQNNDHVKTIPL